MKSLEYSKLTDPGIDRFTFSELSVLEQIGGNSYYLFDSEKLKENIGNLRRSFGNKVSISYSVKANPWLAECAREYVDYLEVCSPGELRKVLQNRWNINQITLDGLLKTPEEIKVAIQKNIRRISIDSLSQWDMVYDCAKRQVKNVNVLLRLTSGNQFGMNLKEILDILERNKDNQVLHIEGIHYYTGTQRKYVGEVKRSFQYLQNTLDEIEKQLGRPLELIELGGGAPVPYFLEDNSAEYFKAYEALGECVRSLSERIPVLYEAGRILSASAGCYITKIINYKSRPEAKIVLVSGGTHHLTYYGSIAGRKTPRIRSVFSEDDLPSSEETVTVCGSLCTEQDIMARNVKLQKPLPSVYLVFGLAGAYSVTECRGDFLSRSRPAILLRKKDGKIEVLRPLEEVDYLYL